MSEIQECYVCQSPAELVCRCENKQYLCPLHISQHIRSNPHKHTLEAFDNAFTLSDLKILESILNQLNTEVLYKTNLILQARNELLFPLLQKIRNVEMEFNYKIKNLLLNEREKVEEIKYLLRKKAISSVCIEERLVILKNRGEENFETIAKRIYLEKISDEIKLDSEMIKSENKSRTKTDNEFFNPTDEFEIYEKLKSSLTLLTKFPEYRSKLTKSLETKLGKFIYDSPNQDSTQVYSLKPVKLEDGSVYEGEWNEFCQKHGKGYQIELDGSIYEGYWMNNRAHGKGRYIDVDGNIYEGKWKEGKADGLGKLSCIDGTTYTGEFQEDKEHGWATETFPDEGQYEGYFRDGKKNGTGKFIWSNGDIFEGGFVKNKIEGQGTYRWADGREYMGEWRNSKMHGRGVFGWPDGREYEGEYVNDVKEGFGIFRWPDGKRFEGNWLKGKQHGQGIYFSGDRISIKGEWQEGKRIKRY